MRQMTAALAIAASIAVPVLAQDKPAEPAAPAAPVAPAPPAAPSAVGKAFGEADRSADAIKKADAILAAAAKAYQAAPSLTEKITIGMEMPDGRNEEVLTAEYGPNKSFRMSAGGASLMAVGGMAYFLPDEPKDKYIEQKIEGSVGKTFGGMLPGFAMPTAALAMRDGVAGDDLVEAMGGIFLQEPKVAGSRSGEGTNEVLITGTGGEVVIVFDSTSNLQKGLRATLSPPGAPADMSFNIEGKVENTIADKLEKEIVFEKGERTAVASVMDLMGGGEEPEMKVKVGDAAPISELTTIDGSPVDLAAMKGKVIVLDFWATWCGPCRKGLPLLQKFADSMKDNEKVVVHPVNVWERMEHADRIKAVSEYWAKEKFTMATLIDPENKFVDAYGFSGIPAFVIIDPNGKVASLHVGFDEKMVENLTKEVNEALQAK